MNFSNNYYNNSLDTGIFQGIMEENITEWT